MAERTIVKHTLAALNARGVAWKIYGNPVQTKGLPDILGCVYGFCVGVECKDTEQEVPTPIQAYWLERIAAAGGVSGLVRSQGELEAFLAVLDAKKEQHVP